jgi:hypothetical protein
MTTASLTSQCQFSFRVSGSKTFPKISYPTHPGIYNTLETDRYIFHFNLNNEIIRAKGKDKNWRHPHEWFKRTMGNDWVYYSTGGYTGVFEATGEYYLPNFNYSSNNIIGGKPFKAKEISGFANDWFTSLQTIANAELYTPAERRFLYEVLLNNPTRLQAKAQLLHNIIGGRVSVLPPDARHVGYNLIPVTISRGCLYKCKFCSVKNNHPFKELPVKEIDQQIEELRRLYGNDLINYNAIYLGEHDALNASPGTILHSIHKAYNRFGLYDSYLDGVSCFFFGSATSLLEAPEQLFFELNQIPGMVYINIGLESPNQSTLDQLGKPITSAQVWDAFKRIQSLNRAYANLEISVNLIMDENLPPAHYKEVEQLIRDTEVFQQAKGTVYFSPLTFNKPSRSRMFEFNRLKLMSRFPTFLYIIQRL